MWYITFSDEKISFVKKSDSILYRCTTKRITIKRYTLMQYIHTKEDNRTKRSHPMHYGCAI